jgi:hypothetical protein
MRTLAKRRALRIEALDSRCMLAVTYGVIGSVGPQPGVAKPVGAIEFTPSQAADTIESIVASRPGATFYFRAGTYTDVAIRPLTGQTFVGEFGTILTSARESSAFMSSAANVTISNITVAGYVPASPNSAIHASLATGWTVDHVEVYGSAVRGVTLFDGGKLTNSYIHDNEVLGVKVDGLAGYSGRPEYHTANGAPTLVQNNIISHNNPNNKGDVGWEAGGLKVWEANNVSVLSNNTSGNIGHGIWFDTVRAGGVVRYNLSQSNSASGIYNELANGTLISNNRVMYNAIGSANATWPGAGGIVVDNSSGVRVVNNQLMGNGNSIITASTTRSQDGVVWKLNDVLVASNVIIMSLGRTGSVWESPAGGTSANVRWMYNRYLVSGTAGWVWNNWQSPKINWQKWQAAGNDTVGTMQTG